MKRAVVIYPDGHVSPAMLDADNIGKEVKTLQQLVGGYIQVAPSRAPNLTLFCNEEAWSIPDDLRKPNELATALADAGVIVGPVVVMGPVNSSGDTLGLTVEQAEIFLDPKGEDILNALVG